MAKFPKIQRMCPFKNSVSKNMDGDVCRLCDRKVHNLDTLNDAQRVKVLDACSEEVCVSYTLRQKRKIIAAAISTAMVTLPIAAQDAVESYEEPFVLTEVIIVGAIKDSTNVEYVDSAEDLKIPDLPVTYENEEG